MIRFSQAVRGSGLLLACLIHLNHVGAQVPEIRGPGFQPGFESQTPRFGFPDSDSSLQALPRMQALPLKQTAPGKLGVPDALQSPSYCDSPTLRDSATLRAIRFWDDQQGVAVGDHGTIVVTSDGGKSWTAAPTDVTCCLSDAVFLSETRVIAVGGGFDAVTRISRGVVLVSSDGGLTWRRGMDSGLPRLRSIEEVTSATRPGRRVLRARGNRDPVSGSETFESTDGGRNWQTAEADRTEDAARTAISVEQASAWSRVTGLQSAVRSSCRLGDRTLLAAGDHGVIVRSIDGGESWQTVRGKDRATAILFVAASSDHIPWSLVGREGLEHRVRTNIVVGHHPAESEAIERVRQAAMQLGAVSLDGYEHAGAEDIQHWIAIHRPPVVAIDSSFPDSMKTALLQHAVAVGTEKVVEFSRHDRGESMLHRGALLPGCGVLAGDFELDAWLLASTNQLTRLIQASVDWISIQTRYNAGATQRSGGSLGEGLRLSDSHRLPPRLSKASRRLLQVTQARLKQQNSLARLIDQSTSDSQLEVSIDQILDQTSRADRFRLACFMIAHVRGTDREHVVWNRLAKRFPQVSAGALARLHAQTRSSAEWQGMKTASYGNVQSSLQVSPLLAPAQAQPLIPQHGRHAALVSPFQTATEDTTEADAGVIQASASSPIVDAPTGSGGESTDRMAAEVDLAWQMHPVRLMVAASQAIASEKASVTAALDQHAFVAIETDDSIVHTDSPDAGRSEKQTLTADLRRVATRDDPWSSLLKDRSAQATEARFTQTPPMLDGRLQESFWSAPATTAGSYPIKVFVAYDQEYIYLATQVEADRFKRSGDAPNELGKRDASLLDADRVRISIDVDRDLLTAFQLSVTRDGRTRDTIDGQILWDPTWYVASEDDGTLVTTEIAIQRSSLGAELIDGDRWLLDVQSIAAGNHPVDPWMPSPTHRVRVDFVTD